MSFVNAHASLSSSIPGPARDRRQCTRSRSSGQAFFSVFQLLSQQSLSSAAQRQSHGSGKGHGAASKTSRFLRPVQACSIPGSVGNYNSVLRLLVQSGGCSVFLFQLLFCKLQGSYFKENASGHRGPSKSFMAGARSLGFPLVQQAKGPWWRSSCRFGCHGTA